MDLLDSYEHNLGQCSVCKRKSICDGHHPDKANRPDWTVAICSSCHRECHAGVGVFIENFIFQSALEWKQNLFNAGVFVHPRQFLEKLDQLGYKPAHDFQIKMGFDSETAWGLALHNGEITMQDCIPYFSEV